MTAHAAKAVAATAKAVVVWSSRRRNVEEPLLDRRAPRQHRQLGFACGGVHA